VLNLGEPATQAAMIELVHHWAAQKPVADEGDFGLELAAIERVFGLAADDRFGACGLFLPDRLAAFSLWEIGPGSGFVVTHFRKMDRSIPGITALLRHEESRYLLALGYKLMNVEQDLGIPGLRAAKQALNPCGFLRKYRIWERR
jgi:hypothetical protein